MYAIKSRTEPKSIIWDSLSKTGFALTSPVSSHRTKSHLVRAFELNEGQGMRIDFKNFGQAGSGSISLADLTVICGPNNSGKTYVNYAVYSALKNFYSFFHFRVISTALSNLRVGKPASINLKTIKKDFDKHLIAAGNTFTKSLDNFFNAPADFFSDSEFFFHFDESEFGGPKRTRMTARHNDKFMLEGEFDPKTGIMTIAHSHGEAITLPSQVIFRIVEEFIVDILLEESVPTPFVVTSERTGVALFYKDLDYSSNAIISELRATKKIDPIKMIEAMRSQYAQPIQDNIDTVRDYTNIRKRKSFLREAKDDYQFVFDALTDLLGGGTFRPSGDQPTFSPKDQSTCDIPMYLASSSIKSLFLVDMYVNHIARENQVLIIDEPELNLHPDNQVRFARLIARLVNAKVKILLTTHSDYIVREINNLVSMSEVSVEKSELHEKYKIIEQDVLTPSKVRAYCADPTDGFTEITVSKTGIDSTIFDNIISEENAKAQDIYFTIEE